jgi:taurine dioxygenase
MASYRKIEVKPLAGALGAEISGVNLKHVDDETFSEIQSAWLEHLVVFFRNQKITPQEQIAFAKRFGDIHYHPFMKSMEEHPEILEIVKEEGDTRAFGETWHTDQMFNPKPAKATILYAKETPSVGGDTMFANMYLAYETLSEPVRKFVDGLTAVHDGEKRYRGHYGDDRGRIYPRAEHPIVRTHPVTGKKCLFVNRFFTTHIVGLRREESDAILEMLFRHIETPEFAMRFQWQPNSIAFWDNRCAQHHAVWDYYPSKRYGHRVTICGDKPY